MANWLVQWVGQTIRVLDYVEGGRAASSATDMSVQQLRHVVIQEKRTRLEGNSIVAVSRFGLPSLSPRVVCSCRCVVQEAERLCRSCCCLKRHDGIDLSQTATHRCRLCPKARFEQDETQRERRLPPRVGRTTRRLLIDEPGRTPGRHLKPTRR
jgi:hypothetical protein